MMDFQWLTIGTVCLLGAMSPGPSLAVVVRNSAVGGRSCGLVAAWSHAAGVGVYALATVFGLTALVAQYPAFTRGVALAGAAYLFWLGVVALRSARGQSGEATGPGAMNLIASARDGFAIALMNPKIALFFLALFSGFVDPQDPAASRAGMALIAVVIDGAWYSLMAASIGYPAQRAMFRAHAVTIDRLSGCVFVGAACWILLG
ncbi:MAG: lysine transporter LysE [Gammaproteobacteria bacterium]|nr:lysine transporter LysE [Gammaproteobacteria bacterium]